MTEAELLTEAIDAAITLGWALAAWIAALAALGTAVVLGAAAALWRVGVAVRRRLPRPSTARARDDYRPAA